LEAGRRLPPAVSCGYEIEEIAEILSFSPRWVRAMLKRYNEGGAEALGRPTYPQRNQADHPDASRIGMDSRLMWPLVQALTMSVEAKIKVITCWSLSDRTNR
jgi:transposase